MSDLQARVDVAVENLARVRRHAASIEALGSPHGKLAQQAVNAARCNVAAELTRVLAMAAADAYAAGFRMAIASAVKAAEDAARDEVEALKWAVLAGQAHGGCLSDSVARCSKCLGSSDGPASDPDACSLAASEGWGVDDVADDAGVYTCTLCGGTFSGLGLEDVRAFVDAGTADDPAPRGAEYRPAANPTPGAFAPPAGPSVCSNCGQYQHAVGPGTAAACIRAHVDCFNDCRARGLAD